jgi:hypothetical protein
MRPFVAISAVLLGTGAGAAPPALDTSGTLGSPGSPSLALPQPPLRDRGEVADPSAGAVCRDRIEAVRDERGLPKLNRDKAASDEALLIAAVDRRIGGCSVMVMRNDTSDIRPLPRFQDGPPRLTPLKGQ